MIKLEAAARLQVVAAKASVPLARKYLRSLGIKTGKLLINHDSFVRFDLDVRDVESAVSKLESKFSKPRVLTFGRGEKSWAFELSKTRSITVGHKPGEASVTLTDIRDE